MTKLTGQQRRAQKRKVLAMNIVTPVRGTVRYVDGREVGVWGVTHPIQHQKLDADGSVIELTPAEQRLAARMYG